VEPDRAAAVARLLVGSLAQKMMPPVALSSGCAGEVMSAQIAADSAP
jgi:hypothetical protein